MYIPGERGKLIERTCLVGLDRWKLTCPLPPPLPLLLLLLLLLLFPVSLPLLFTGEFKLDPGPADVNPAEPPPP